MSALGDFPLYPTNGQIYTNDYGFSWRWNGNTSIKAWEKYVRSVTSFNGITGDVQGVSSANGLTGAVTFRAGAGITLSTSGGGISFAIHYGVTGASAPFSIVSPTNLDKFLFQDNETGLMRIVSYSTILTKAAQVGDILSTSPSYTPNNTNFVVQNSSTGLTEMISANDVFSSIDGGIYTNPV